MFDSFSLIFLSILLEALPFVLLGTIISSLIEVFVTPQWIKRHLPNNKLLAYLTAALLGIIFPVCECAIIPIVRRLIKKGTPVGMAITFMLSLPILNPIVMLSTYYAFNNLLAPILRGGLGLLAALIIGFSLDKLLPKEALKTEKKQAMHFQLSPAPKIKGSKVIEPKKDPKKIFLSVINHCNHELYEVGKLLIIGAFISATMQTFIPRKLLLNFAQGDISSIVFMMILAFVLSICSEADAFIASGFRYSFPASSIIAFLIFGPMIDIKNSIMLYGSFQKKFARQLIIKIVVVCFILSLLLSLFSGVTTL